MLFDELMSLVAGRFRGAEPRRTAREFVLGLLPPAERKNCWWLAEQAGNGDPQAMQRLLRTRSDAMAPLIRPVRTEAFSS